jgi:hypothetical protein
MRQRVLFFLVALPVAMLNGQAKPGHGKTVVLIAGDDEYHSEQMMPQFAEILEKRQGFRCTELFSRNVQTGQIDPHARGNIPGLAALEKADLLILFTRFRDLPDEQMKYFVDYVESGKPIFGIRTATRLKSRAARHTADIRGTAKKRAGEVALGAACWAKRGLRITAITASKVRADGLWRNRGRIRFYAGSQTARFGFLRMFTK